MLTVRFIGIHWYFRGMLYCYLVMGDFVEMCLEILETFSFVCGVIGV